MVYIFFYKHLTDPDLIRKINDKFDIFDGYVLVKSYDNETNILEISGIPSDNNVILYGKIVNFNMELKDVINKINSISEVRFENRNTKYKLDRIWANRSTGNLYHSYIIY